MKVNPSTGSNFLGEYRRPARLFSLLAGSTHLQNYGKVAGWRPCPPSCSELSIRASDNMSPKILRVFTVAHFWMISNDSGPILVYCVKWFSYTLQIVIEKLVQRSSVASRPFENCKSSLDQIYMIYYNFLGEVEDQPGFFITAGWLNISPILSKVAGWRPCPTSCGELSIRASDKIEVASERSQKCS